MSSAFIGVDLGTSGCRGICIDEGGKQLARASRPLPASTHPRPGWSEQDPEDWWQAVLAVLAELAQATRGYEIRAIALDGTSGTLLLSDRQGRPLSPGIMYDDRRAVEEVRQLASLAPDQTAILNPGASLPKLLWLKKQDAIPRQALALHQSEWISGRLCGQPGLGDENNCLKLGYDPRQQDWPAWMKRLDLPPALLPRVLPVGKPMGQVSAETAALTRLPPHCRVIAGTTDSTAAALAAGLERPGDALTSLGSTLVCKILVDHPLQAPQYGIYSHRIFDCWLAGGASNSGGAVLRQHFTDREIEELSRRIRPDRRSCLEYYPLPAPGERFPFNDPGKQPRLSPVPRERTRFLQGILEGIARVEKLGYRRLEELGAGYPLGVVTSGGGAGNETWGKIRQRMLGIPVSAASHGEPAHGSALIALRGTSREPR